MCFFDFLSSVDPEKYSPAAINRMNLRSEFIINSFRDVIEDARVLDLASHDGRWCYAFAAAGAKAVLGIEGRKSLAEQFALFPEASFKSRVQLIVSDIFSAVRELVNRKEHFDIVAVLGIYYHVMIITVYSE